MRVVRALAAVAAATTALVAAQASAAYAAPTSPKLTLTVARTGSTANGATTTYTFTVTNTAGPTTGLVTLTDTVNAGHLAFQSGSGAWSCPAAGALSPVVCTLSGLAANGSATLSLSYLIVAPAGTSVTNTGKASTPGELAGNAKNTAVATPFTVTPGVPVTPDPEPTPEPTPTETVTPEPTPTETATPDPTPTETATPDPTPTETATPEPTPTETVTEPAPEPTPTETVTEPAPEPTPTETATEPAPEPTETETATPQPEPTETVPAPAETAPAQEETPANAAPAFTDAAGNSAQTIHAGDLPVAVEAADADGDALTYSHTAGELPPGIELAADGSFTGAAGLTGGLGLPFRLAYRPLAGPMVLGVWTASITATDPGGDSDTTVLTITVVDDPTGTGTPVPATDPGLPPVTGPEQGPAQSHTTAQPRPVADALKQRRTETLPFTGTGFDVMWLVELALVFIGAGAVLNRRRRTTA